MEKVLSMLKEERERELSARNLSDTEIIGGIARNPSSKMESASDTRSETWLPETKVKLLTRASIPDCASLDMASIQLNSNGSHPAIQHAIDNCEVIVIDEIGKFAVESEAFVNAVRNALEIDKPTLLTLHKKSRHPLLQDIRRRDDGRILEVTPVNRALLPYKIHKLMRETY